MSTVHVIDVCRALWHLTSHGSSGDVFNLADKSDTCKTCNPQNMIVNNFSFLVATNFLES